MFLYRRLAVMISEWYDEHGNKGLKNIHLDGHDIFYTPDRFAGKIGSELSKEVELYLGELHDKVYK